MNFLTRKKKTATNTNGQPTTTSNDISDDTSDKRLDRLERIHKLTYDKYHESKEKQQALRRQAVLKALNLPDEEDVNIDQNIRHNHHTHHGMGWKELLLLGTFFLAFLGSCGIGYFIVINPNSTTPTTPTPTPTPTVINEEAVYEVKFYDKDGNLIPVKHYSATTTTTTTGEEE